LRPMLLQRFPGLTAEQLRTAHAFAYGGAVIQDLGYYPFGSREFSDLAHYVRSGDFVAEMIRQSIDVNEYAFALGALAHYCSDMDGHPAVNRATAIEYPELRRKFGPVITYAEKPGAHLQTEFGFDVAQVARRRYTSTQYHDFIGFEVANSLLDRSFSAVYGIPLRDVLHHEDLAIGTYRWAVGKAIPRMTEVALATRRDQMIREEPNFSRQKFLYHLSRAQYQRDWGKEYRRAGAGARLLGVILRVLPHVGPLKGAAFRRPNPRTEDLYFQSVDATVTRYRELLKAVRSNSLQLANLNLDTGRNSKAGEYTLADAAYGRLLRQLSQGKWALSNEMRAAIGAFYGSSDRLTQPSGFASRGANGLCRPLCQ
ncbi:MAG: zinc dependent phospholipase C family protein, partial [Acidobacteria bacterium]|nr:zinc dependent phospholipase C family protein [Acidobacteriota bacterium]